MPHAGSSSGTELTNEDRYVVVSTDSHVGPSVKGQLREYCESAHLADFDRFVEEMEGHGLMSWRSSEASKPGEEQSWSLGKQPKERKEPRERKERTPSSLDEQQAQEFGKVAGIRNADQVDLRFIQRSYEASLLPGLQDHSARIADMDASGVAAAVIYHGGLNGQSIPFSTTGLITWGDTRYNHLEPAGVRIYNRWLADFVCDAPERHAGIAHIPISDPEACVREVEWAAEHGLRGINLPAPRSDLPPLNDPVWEPLWAVCSETGMSLNTHGGGGEHYPYKGPGAQAMYMMETTWRTRRGVWVMILAGIFDRYPDLKLVMTEQWMDWAVQVIADMDGLYTGPSGMMLRATLPEPPSTYFRRNCFIGASFLSNWEAKLAVDHDLTANTMWGDDYPHAEGSWPHTRESMRFTFCDVDPVHAQQLLGDTAIDVYGLDRAALQQVAARIGPTVAELASPYTPPADEALGLYAFRTGPGIFV
jgi:predicted TIM-barrel fold metal-dependent hydrolase